MKNGRSIASALFVVGLLSLFGIPQAAAQGRTWAGDSLAQMIESARWRFGVFRVNALLALTNAGYDSDVYYGYVQSPVDDFSAAVSLPIQVLLPFGKKAALEINERPEYLYFLQTAGERAWSNTLGARAHWALEKVYFQAGAGRAELRRRLNPELDVNIREKTDSLSGTVLWQASEKISLAVLYGFAKYVYGEDNFAGFDLAEALNRRENSADLVAYVQPGSKTRFFIDGQYSSYAFTEAASRGRNARSFGAFSGLSFIPRQDDDSPVAPPQGNISIGFKYFDFLDPALVDGSGFVGAIDVSMGLFPKTSARAFFSRDFIYSAYSNGTYFMSTSYGAGIGRRLTRRATANYDLIMGVSAYPGGTSGQSAADRNFRFSNHAFTINVQLSRYLSISVLAQLGRRRFNEAAAPSMRNFFGFGLMYGLSPRPVSMPARGLSGYPAG